MNQREIAKNLGVSQVAVSLVLRNPQTTRVSAEKKGRIIAALRENGFFNSAGMKRTWAVGFITDALQSRDDEFIHAAVCGAEEENASCGCISGSAFSAERRLLRRSRRHLVAHT